MTAFLGMIPFAQEAMALLSEVFSGRVAALLDS